MKKFFYLIVLIFSTFIIFSCASTEVEDTQTSQNIEKAENETISEASETSDEGSEDLTEASDSDSSTNNTFIEENPLISESFPELENIEEPEITDLEWIEEEETEKEEKAFEPVPEEEVLEDKNIIEEVTNKEESDTAENTEVSIGANTEINTSEKENENSSSAVKTISKKEKTEKKNNFEDDEIIDLTENQASDDILEIIDEDTEEAQAIIIVPSRKVSLKINQTLEIMYPGSGWIYMGSTDNLNDFTFLGKKLGTQNTKFTFRAKEEGNKILHFYKFDKLTDKYIDDYIEVEISAQKDSEKATVKAPEYKQPVIKKEKAVEVAPAQTQVSAPAQVKTPAATSTQAQASVPASTPAQVPAASNSNTSTPAAKSSPAPAKNDDAKTSSQQALSTAEENLDTEKLLSEAEELYNNKSYKEALNKLSNFFEYASNKRDQALFLQGKIYEADSELKNIKKAIDSYKTLINNYPASIYWDDSNKRIIYLTKFYLEGR